MTRRETDEYRSIRLSTEPWAVECSFCDAKAGNPCRSLAGVPVSYAHYKRVDLYLYRHGTEHVPDTESAVWDE